MHFSSLPRMFKTLKSIKHNQKLDTIQVWILLARSLSNKLHAPTISKSLFLSFFLYFFISFVLRLLLLVSTSTHNTHTHTVHQQPLHSLRMRIHPQPMHGLLHLRTYLSLFIWWVPLADVGIRVDLPNLALI